MRPSDPALRRIAWVSAALMVVGTAVGIVLNLAAGGVSDSTGFGLLMSPFPIVGFLVILRRPGTLLGWLMFSMGYFIALPLESYATYVTTTRPELPGAALALALAGPMWIPFVGITGFVLLLFPDGQLPSPGWRWLGWTCAIALGVLGFLIATVPMIGPDFGLPEMANPLGIEALEPLRGPAIALASAAPALILGGAVGMILRLRRAADDVERHQLRWLAFSATVVAILFGLGFFGDERWSLWLQVLSVTSFLLIPIAIGIAVLRYRLYDIDFVIRKTVIFAVLAAAIGIVYVAVVVGAGALVGSRSSPILSALAAAVVALVFQPIRVRARRLADRIVYGTRATPYELLTAFGEQLAGTYSAEDVLPRTARALAEGVGALRARVWLRVDDELRVVACWPPDAPEDAMDDLTTEVLHGGEPLGALSVAMPANDPMDPTKEHLVRDLAGHAGLVLSNVRLTEELRARLDDLRAAQKRLVTAQDEERRRLERNIHDGAQQQLVALSVKLRLAQALAVTDGERTAGMLEQLQEETTHALEDLRDLARGIYPPLLADKGLPAALDAQARRSPIPVRVLPDGVGRYAQEVEAAVYFSVLEGLQNIAKYARATEADVHLREEGGWLSFTVADDGVGFDPTRTSYGTGLQGIADRLAALDGALEVRSSVGVGTALMGRVPVRAPVGAPDPGRQPGERS